MTIAFHKAVNNCEQNVGQLITAYKMDIMEVEEKPNKVKAEADKAKAEKESEKNLGDQQKVDKISKEIFKLQVDAPELLGVKFKEEMMTKVKNEKRL